MRSQMNVHSLNSHSVHTACLSCVRTCPAPSNVCCSSYITLMHQACGRSDDTHLLNVCDLVAPILLPCVGPSICMVYMLVLRGGKADKV